MNKVSIVIPAYNEEKYITKLLNNILPINTEIIGFIKEIIVVDDGSTDHTMELAKKVALGSPLITLIYQENQGKGKAVQRGIQEAKGDFVLVQDADLEYNPSDYIPMLKALKNPKTVVYGSRILGQIRFFKRGLPFVGRHPEQELGPWLAGIFLTLFVFLLFGRWITDTLTGYKIYPTDIIRKMDIMTHGFETDHEITAKLIRNGIQIKEIPINYNPRSLIEGKKIKMRDGFLAIWTFIRFRFN